MNILKTLKNKRRIICYITKSDKCYSVKTGKPSDTTCFSWDYDTLENAIKTAEEYLLNYIN